MARTSPDTAERVAAAAVTVVARDGFDVLSVRTVAREAGLSGGAVQYHFATREQLLLAAFAHTVRSITDRLAAAELTGPLPVVLARLGREALPLDEQRHRECVVWAALSAAAAAHPALATEHAQAVDLLTDLLTREIAAAADRGEVHPGVEVRTAAVVLTAVIDGLTLRGITGRSAEELTEALDAAIAMVLGRRT